MGLEGNGERPDNSHPHRARHRSSAAPQSNDVQNKEAQNARALQVLSRVKDKLVGRDFKPSEELNVSAQVEKLINQAVDLENLCQHYIGWCSFW